MCISILLFTSPVFGQDNPAMLAKQLTASCKTEKEKVTAIFKWITENISYRVSPGKKRRESPVPFLKNINGPVTGIDDGPLKPLHERVAETVLLNREGVCDGYARLFTTLCEYAGICTEIIIGYAKSGSNKPIQRFGANHYWNAVMIDGKWYLADATWASGYMNAKGDEFIREYDANYFLASPEQFIRDHYPDDLRWTLLPDSMVPQEFSRSPFKQKSFFKYHFTSYYPTTGIIETFVGDTLRLTLETGHKETGRNVCPDLLIDSSIFSHSPFWIFLKPDRQENEALPNRFNYTYAVSSPEIEWIYLLYNEDLVLRYKINVKKKKA